MQANKKSKQQSFGVDVRVFCVLHGITIKELARQAGIPYDTLHKVVSGRRSGKTVKPKISKLMKEIDAR